LAVGVVNVPADAGDVGDVGDVGAIGAIRATRLRPSFETLEASAFAKAMADTSPGKPAKSVLWRLQLSTG